jgi:hypothetical protein
MVVVVGLGNGGEIGQKMLEKYVYRDEIGTVAGDDIVDH